MNNPLISAIVSTYNSERFIKGCLNDLEGQTIAEKMEIIVVNSNSRQDEDSIIKGFQKKYNNIIYIKTSKRESIYKAWNRAIKASRGKYITNANTDDRHRKDAYEVMVNYLEKNNKIDLVYSYQWISNIENETYSDFIHLDEDKWKKEFKDEMSHYLRSWHIKTIKKNGRNGYFIKWPKYSKRLLFRRCFIGPQPVWRRRVHDACGYFDETFELSSDYDFWLRMAKKGCFFRLIPKILGVFYLGGNNKEFEPGLNHWIEIYLMHKRYNLFTNKEILNILINLVKHLTKRNEIEEYLAELEKYAKKIKMMNYSYFYYLASEYKKIGHEKKALINFNRVISKTKNNEFISGAYFHLGEIYFNRGNMKKAEEHLKICLKKNKEHKKASEYLNSIIQNKSLKKAI